MAKIEPTSEASCTLHGDFHLEAGGEFRSPEVHYAVYGELNERRDNAILVCHALSGSARVADWWPELFPAVFDTSRYCVIGANLIGSCYGSTGPSSLNPVTGVTYGPDFPLVSIRDMVRAHARLLDHLGIERLHTVVGGSIGGMQALQWAVDFPQRVERAIAIGAAPLSAMGLALNHLQRLAAGNGSYRLAVRASVGRVIGTGLDAGRQSAAVRNGASWSMSARKPSCPCDDFNSA